MLAVVKPEAAAGSEIREVKIPAFGPRDVLVKVKVASILLARKRQMLNLLKLRLHGFWAALQAVPVSDGKMRRELHSQELIQSPINPDQEIILARTKIRDLSCCSN